MPPLCCCCCCCDIRLPRLQTVAVQPHPSGGWRLLQQSRPTRQLPSRQPAAECCCVTQYHDASEGVHMCCTYYVLHRCRACEALNCALVHRDGLYSMSLTAVFKSCQLEWFGHTVLCMVQSAQALKHGACMFSYSALDVAAFRMLLSCLNRQTYARQTNVCLPVV
jgi:hypothetical protein